MRRTFILLGALALVVTAAPAFGQKKPAASAAKSSDKPTKTYDFSGDDIDGDQIRPEGDFLDTRRFGKRTSLIRIRTDFVREIVKSAEDL